MNRLLTDSPNLNLVIQPLTFFSSSVVICANTNSDPKPFSNLQLVSLDYGTFSGRLDRST